METLRNITRALSDWFLMQQLQFLMLVKFISNLLCTAFVPLLIFTRINIRCRINEAFQSQFAYLHLEYVFSFHSSDNEVFWTGKIYQSSILFGARAQKQFRLLIAGILKVTPLGWKRLTVYNAKIDFLTWRISPIILNTDHSKAHLLKFLFQFKEKSIRLCSDEVQWLLKLWWRCLQ